MDEVARSIAAWMGTIVGDVPVALAARGSELPDRGIGLLLLEVHRSAAPRGTRRTPLALSARFLVTIEAADPAESYRLVGELAFAAVEDTELEIELEPVPAHVWAMLAATARPALIVRVPVRRARPEPEGPRVREPLVAHVSPVVALEGRVLGPGDFPIPYARIEAPGLGAAAYADPAGFFRLAPLPLDPPLRELIVKAKGVRTTIVAEESAGFRTPLTVRLSEAEV
jgi:hypothetical protein